MNAIKAFKYERQQIRTVIKNDEIWFVAKDVAKALGYTNTRDAISRHLEEDEKGVAFHDTLGGKQQFSIINESGLYSLILSSHLPDAKKFKRWVTSEVLPAIRREGGYISDAATEEQIATLTARLAEKERALKAERRRCSSLKKKALTADLLEVSDSTCSVGELATLLTQAGWKIGQNRLFERLRQDGYLIRAKRTDRNMPTQKAIDGGWLVIEQRALCYPDGRVNAYRQTKVTTKGQQYFMHKYLKEEGIYANA